jgi:alkanesulfonate monooxygenase SsuD/methylene tetrahydromethanopterin reductase-like flavin-dependent oxidoreductase (luciferase family)
MAVAAGWMEGEFRTLGADFEHRGRALNDWLELASSVYDQPAGPVLDDAWMAPALVRRGGLELWVAGVSRATLRRAARTGVWHPVGLRPDEVRAMAQEFRALRADGRVVLRINAYFANEPDREGADERGRYAIAGPPEWIAERLAELVEAGCDGFVLNLDQERPALEERVARFGAEVRPLIDGR